MKSRFIILLYLVTSLFGLSIQAKSPLPALGSLVLLSLGDYVYQINKYNIAIHQNKETASEQSLKEKVEEVVTNSIGEIEAVDQEERRLSIRGCIAYAFYKMKVYSRDPISFSEQPWFNLLANSIVFNFFTGSYEFPTFKSLDEVESIADKISEESQGAERVDILRTLPSDVLIDIKKNQKKIAKSLKESFEKLDTEEAQKNKFYSVRKRLYEALHGQACVREAGKKVASRCVCLNGSPGVGKTRFAEEIASDLDYAFHAIPLGGGRSSSGHSDEIKGSSSVYLGSKQGQIIKALQKMKKLKKQGLVILLDEIDKTVDPNGILDLTDSEQNRAFRDLFLDLPVDLSSVVFIATSNNFDSLQSRVPFLANRFDRIDIPDYTNDEKKELVKSIFDDENQKLFMPQMIEFCNEKNTSFINDSIDTFEDGDDGGVRTLFARLSRVQNMILFDPSITKEAIFERLKK
ncbi:hypothetical protein COB28_01210 [Candidatus Dependentiae bacterium]|nr:MAG: hypothetical protein COB28_01210 [Candidatus Dependentiae bacterium]